MSKEERRFSINEVDRSSNVIQRSAHARRRPAGFVVCLCLLLFSSIAGAQTITVNNKLANRYPYDSFPESCPGGMPVSNIPSGFHIERPHAVFNSTALASVTSLSSVQNKDGKPDFTGKWKAESLTKEAGEPPIPPGAEKEINEVDQKDPELKIRRSFEELAGVIELRFTIDGKEGSITDPNGSTFKSKAGWNGKRLIITAGEQKETWDLSDDRKTLIITKEFRDITWKMVYKRQ